jgi:hypothetical protein
MAKVCLIDETLHRRINKVFMGEQRVNPTRRRVALAASLQV